MQGESIGQSIIAALERIYQMQTEDLELRTSLFDCVVIIRGGGATSDMSGFDTLALAENVANFPIPIITGIGHDRDESVLDMVSHTRVKTPTAAATLLIDHLKAVQETIEGAQSMITHYVQQKLSIANSHLSIISESIPRLFSVVKTRQEAKIDALYTRMPMLIERRLTTESHRLQLIDEKLKALDPALLLARGYSITLHNGKSVRDPQQLQPGDEIETRVEKGIIKSIIT
jgi:exodeoxyribonuclease VII large subunit